MNWRRCLCGAVALALALAIPVSAKPPAHAVALAYRIEEGRNLNAFYRQGPVAAHMLLRSGEKPRLIVAFPAGNSGVGLWFGPASQAARWRIDTAPRSSIAKDHLGRPLYGIVANVSIATPRLDLGQAVLSSVRVLRDFEFAGSQPGEVTASPRVLPRGLVWQRDRLDGAAGYRLALEVLAGRIEGKRIFAGPDGRIALRITAQSGEEPMTPIAPGQLLTSQAAKDPAARNTLEFLSYREKFLAGSWRFNTYFGRDTLMSIRLLMPVLKPQAVEAGLGAVLDRLSPEGEVAHEEDIGEFAVLDHLRSDGTKSDAPVYDYKMIDGTPLLALVAGHWLLDDPRSRQSAKAFLGSRSIAARSHGAALVANLEQIATMGKAFAADPRPHNLVRIKPGLNVGNWRDSEDGLGLGRYPYDVNAALMPSALALTARLEASGLLDPWLDQAGHQRLRQTERMAAVWRARAPALFDLTIDQAKARAAIAAQSGTDALSVETALGSVPAQGLTFPALALDDAGRTIPVLHSDLGFVFLFADPPGPELERMVTAAARPYPAGLMTPAGMLVANATFSPSELRARLSRAAYHGAVVWSWQQALMLAGLDRQLQRRDLQPQTRAELARFRDLLRGLINANRKLANSELWSWADRQGKIVPTAFGSASADADESNAAQLWSAAFLATGR